MGSFFVPWTGHSGARPGALWIVAAILGCSGAPSATQPVTPSPGTPPPPASPGTTVVSDEFDRSTLGTSWSIQTNTGGVVSLVGGDLGTGSGSLLIVSYVGSSLPPDQFSEVRLSTAYDNGAMKGVQVFVRRQGAVGVTAWRYGFHYYNPSGKYTLKYDGGPTTGTDFLQEVAGSPPQPGDVLRIEVRGTTLKGLVNGVEVARATDGRLSGGLAGIAINPARASPRVVARWSGGGL